MPKTVKIQITKDELEKNIRTMTKSIEQDIKKEFIRRAQNQAPIEVRNATNYVLSGKRSGRRYGKHIASKPGEAPAHKSGDLRRSHLPFQTTTEIADGIRVISGVKTDVRYAKTLDKGYDDDVRARRGKDKKYKTYRLTIKPRPYVEKSKKKAVEKIKELYRGPYR